jgi:glucose-6-phosphate isomerase
MPGLAPSQIFMLNRSQQSAADAAVAKLRRLEFVRRLLAKDPTLWKRDEEHARVIRNRMGWLEVAGRLLGHALEIRTFAEQVRAAGIRHVVLLGMGGSSLCPDVLRSTFRRKPGFPALLVLDSTDPGMVAAIDKAIDPRHTLFIVASKSGTTLESQMFYQYFAASVPGDRFAAITDPGTKLEEMARAGGFLRVFTNPPDIGGRYSALSYFGMVPGACLGIDVGKLLERGDRMAKLLQPAHPIQDCPPVVLGATLGALGLAGRDKITFVASPAIATFGYWVEQLIAESTGKEGKGLVPVEGEALGPPAIYGKDRVFVHLRLRGAKDTAVDRKLSALRRAGHPCIIIHLDDLYDLGTEFNRWEIATATAGCLLGIDPFDEPNVKESKDNTARVLEQYRATRVLPSSPPDISEGGVDMWTTVPFPLERGGRKSTGLQRVLHSLCHSVRPGDYIALTAYMQMDAPTKARLQKLRLRLRDRCRAATTLGFGPRFLHSTGQLHKGGAGNGVFLQITCDRKQDLGIPGEDYSFGVLQAAQAAGDFASLANHRRRVVRLHLTGGVLKQIEKITASV